MTDLRRFFSVPLLLFIAACNGSSEPHRATPVVLIVVDTLRADHLGTYGHSRDTSPNIDSLASDAVVYRNAYSTAPWTTPSIGSLLSSQYPVTLGVRSVSSVLSDELVMLPEVLRDSGYVTGAVISHTFCSKRWNFDQGFDEFDQSSIAGPKMVTSTSVTQHGLRFIDRHKDEPFFLWLHYFDPHVPYLLHDEFPFGAGKLDTWVKSGLNRKAFGKHSRSEDDRQEIMRIYDSEIGLTDQAVGKVLDRLKELDLYDRSLIIFTADHGEEFWEHGRLGHSRSLHDELVNVPLLIKLPGNLQQEVDTPVSLIDVYPTILSILGVSIDHSVAGQDLNPGQPSEPRLVFFDNARGEKKLQGVVLGRFKLIRNTRLKTLTLYDLESDPSENENIAAERPQVVADLKSRLDSWASSLKEGERLKAELSAEELQLLSELGYSDE